MGDAYSDYTDSEEYQISLHNYLHLVGMTIFYYDYALTFGEEYARIWKQSSLKSNFLFLINRYLTFFGDVAVNVGNFYSFKTTKVSSKHDRDSNRLTQGARVSCSQYAFYRQALLIGAQVVVCVILFLRTSALYSGRKSVAGTILVTGITLAGLAIYAVVGQHEAISLSGGCHAAATRDTAIHIAVAWESLFAFDLMIFSLTMYQTWKQRPQHLVRTDRLDIISLMLRDGAIYFAVMASVNLSNTLTFYLLQPLLRGVLSTFASSISVTMMSRLMLNLHENASIHSTITNPSTSDNSTTVLFTSGLVMDEGDMMAVRPTLPVQDTPDQEMEVTLGDDDQLEGIELRPVVTHGTEV